MMQVNQKRLLNQVFLIVLMMVLFIFGLQFGFIQLSIKDVIKTLLGDDKYAFVILTLRAPRLMITASMGMALALSGSVLQTLTKNDLADPGILGINAGAGLGVTVAYLFLDFNQNNIVYLLPIMGFLGASLTFLITFVSALDKNRVLDVNKLVLIGIGSAISISGAMILLVSSAGREDVQFIYKWLSGSIWGDKWIFVQITIPLVTILTIIILLKSNTLNILQLDDISTQSLGVDLKKERLLLMTYSVALAAVVVSVAGSISFVGLIIPHISKRIYGPKHQHFLIGSMLMGALFLMGADIIGRNILLPHGLLPGIVVSIIGAPYFLYLIVKK